MKAVLPLLDIELEHVTDLPDGRRRLARHVWLTATWPA